jgi:hypothetical protein
VNFYDWIWSPRTANTWHSWWSMAITIPFVFGILFTLPKARQEAQAASRQQAAQGSVTSYQRSDHNRCSYTFTVLGRSYSGRDSSPMDDIAAGERVTVYYDREDPTYNALEDFSKQAGRDQGFALICLCGVGIVAGVVLYNKWQQKRESV